MVLVFPKYDAEKVFAWARERPDRVSVLVPAPPMVTKCLRRILREAHQGKTVLAWGDEICIENLKHRLEASGVETYDFIPEQVIS